MSQSPQLTDGAMKANSEHPVSDKLKNSLHDSVDTLAGKAAKAEETIRDTTQASAETLEQKQKEMQDKWETSRVKQYATENPVATAGIAFAAGMLVSSLLKTK